MTDNGSNIVKAVRLLGDRGREQSSESEDGDVSQAQPRRAGDGQDEVSQMESESDESDAEGEESGGLVSTNSDLL